MRRRSVAIIALAALAGTLLLAWSQPWFVVELAPGTGVSGRVDISGSSAAGGLAALALALLAIAGVLALAGPRLSRILGVLIAVLGVLGVAVVTPVVLDPSAVLERAIGPLIGLGGAGAGQAVAGQIATAWPIVGLAAAAATVLVGGAILLLGGSWRRGGRKYDRSSSSSSAGAGHSAVDSWDALSQGDDPTRVNGRAAPER